MKYHVQIDTEDGRQINTWGVFPVGQTKILDGIYNPEGKHLTLLFDSVTQQNKAFEVPRANGKVDVQTRKLDTYYQFKLPEQDIQYFLDNYVENNFEVEANVVSKIITEEHV